MSDEEYEYEYDSDADFEDEQQSEQDEAAIAVENTYYEAEDCKGDNPKHALELFKKVVELERNRENQEWLFKASEHIVKLQYALGLYDEMVKSYVELLKLMDTVTRNECTDTINSILDTIGSGEETDKMRENLSKMYQVTLDALKKGNNERLWFNTNTKMGKMYLENKEYKKLEKVVQELHASCEEGKKKGDPNVGTYLLEVYALEIAMYGAMGQKKKLKEIYPKTRKLNAAIQDPRIMGGIHETGGKMFMEDGQWSNAYDEFFEGFRNYQEAGNPRAKQCLKYVVLANMIALKDINPFDSREAKVYKDDPEIQAMVNLRLAFETSDVKQFEKVLHDKRTRIAEDPFVKKYVENLLRNIRSKVMVLLVKPYNKVTLEFLSAAVNVPREEVESILIDLIADEQVRGKINQRDGYLELVGQRNTTAAKKQNAMENWANTVNVLHSTIRNRLTVI